jgi:hypothetical protein
MDALEDSARQQVEKNKRARQNARQNAKMAALAGQTSVHSLNDGLGPSSTFPSSGAHPRSSSRLPDHQFNVSSREDSRSLGIVQAMTSLPSGQTALTPVASRVREQDADAFAQFIDAFKYSNNTNRSEVVDPGKSLIAPSSRHGQSQSSTTGLTGVRAAFHKLKQSVSLNEIRGVANPSYPQKDEGDEIDNSEQAMTPRASTSQSPLNARDSITPPASRKSPLNVLLSRSVSHQD